MKTLALFLFGSGLALANTYVVNTAEDQLDTPSGPFVSLREAIRDAGNQAATICFDPSMSGKTIYTGVQGQLSPMPNGGKITIDGSGLAKRVAISGLRQDGGAPVTLSQFVHQNSELELRNLIIEDALESGVMTLGQNDDLSLFDVVIRRCGYAGVTFAGDFLNMSDCEVYQNGTKSALYLHGGVDAQGGNSVTMRRCAIYQNSGSGILLPKLATGYSRILNTTVAENIAKLPTLVGGIVGMGESKADILYTTVVDNVGYGIGSSPNDSIRLDAVIIGRNRLLDGTKASLLGSEITSRGYNICDDAPAVLNHAADRLSLDPKVTRIGYHGGKVLCCLPLEGSPAINGGSPTVALTVVAYGDARGFPREASHFFAQRPNIIDIGAVEVNTETTYTVSSISSEGGGSLRAAIEGQGPSRRRIVFSPKMSGETIDLFEVNLVRGGWHIDIDATSLSEPVKIKSTHEKRVLEVSDGASVSINGVTFEGSTFVRNGTSGVLRVHGGASLGMTRCTLGWNSARGLLAEGAGRIHLNESFVTANNISSTLTGAGEAGAIYCVDTEWIQIWNSTIYGNRVLNGTVGRGGGIRSVGGTSLELWNTTWHQNQANREGGAIYCDDGHLQVDFSTFTENLSGGGAIAISGGGRAVINRSVFAENNPSSASVSGNDFKIATGGILQTSGCWTTAVGDSPGYYQGENETGVAMTLTPLGDNGGRIQTQQILSSDAPMPEVSLRALDARGVAAHPVPGAVADPIILRGELVMASVLYSGGVFEVTVRNPQGLRWRMFTSENALNFVPTNVYVEPATTGETTLTVPWNGPLPERLFVRFEQVL